MSTWIIPADKDPLDYFAFTYRVTFPNGQYYLGKKNLWVLKAKKIVKASNWKDYWGSSIEVQDLVKQYGEANCTREVLTLCVSPGEASWEELMAIVGGVSPAIKDPLCLNKNVLMTFNKKVLTGYDDTTRRTKYLNDIKKQKKAAGLDE